MGDTLLLLDRDEIRDPFLAARTRVRCTQWRQRQDTLRADEWDALADVNGGCGQRDALRATKVRGVLEPTQLMVHRLELPEPQMGDGTLMHGGIERGDQLDLAWLGSVRPDQRNHKGLAAAAIPAPPRPAHARPHCGRTETRPRPRPRGAHAHNKEPVLKDSNSDRSMPYDVPAMQTDTRYGASFRRDETNAVQIRPCLRAQTRSACDARTATAAGRIQFHRGRGQPPRRPPRPAPMRAGRAGVTNPLTRDGEGRGRPWPVAVGVGRARHASSGGAEANDQHWTPRDRTRRGKARR